MKMKGTIVIGLTQKLAIIHGILRSRVTISSGLLLGLNKEFITKSHFILAISTILGATLVQIKDISIGLDLNTLVYIVGFLAAVISGYLLLVYF